MDGLTLGGGLELALCCGYRIGTPRTALAFPETGIGIYPGLGGTQRTPRLIGKGLAKFLIATGQMLDAERALQFGLIDLIIERVKNPVELAEMKLPTTPATAPIGESGHLLEEAFADFNGTITAELFRNDVLKKHEKVLKQKAPLALKKAMNLIDEGMRLELEQGLELELESLNWIFGTQDAKIGLSSILRRERPNYLGK